MAGHSRFYAVLLLAIVASVAAQQGGVDPYGATKVPVGTKFQLSVREDGEVHYFYSEGEKVLKTSNPDSVGVERTIWESVQGASPRSIDYIDAFAIRNIGTGFTLLYNADQFYGEYIQGSPVAGWKLYESPREIIPPQFNLLYLPLHTDVFIPGVFNYKPVA